MSRGHQQNRRRTYGRRQHEERQVRRQRSDEALALDIPRDESALPPEPRLMLRAGASLRWAEGAA